MKILIGIPHVFNPKNGSLYSSEREDKRDIKMKALKRATVENIKRHGRRHWIHASLGKNKPVVTREQQSNNGVDITIQIYTPPNASVDEGMIRDQHITRIDPETNDYSQVPIITSRRVLEQSNSYDMVAYMEDDLLIEDPEFFQKLNYIHKNIPEEYLILPHRCEHIPEKGDVILSGDPDGGRPDLFWDTGEKIKLRWPTGDKIFYRATNPHSGCYFLSKIQAKNVLEYWESKNWKSEFRLSGPLEQAGSGMLLKVMKIMKPIPEDYRFLNIRHQDELWKRHMNESEIEAEIRGVKN